MAELVARRIVVRGLVQGVWFRASARDEATRHGVTGWVRNRHDGAVELHLEGPPASVQALLEWIEDGGPPRAVIESLERRDVLPAGASSFEIVR